MGYFQVAIGGVFWVAIRVCGKPLIRGLRISVEMLLELLAKGATEQEILEDYPELESDDVRAALIYAHYMVATEEVFERVKV